MQLLSDILALLSPIPLQLGIFVAIYVLKGQARHKTFFPIVLWFLVSSATWLIFMVTSRNLIGPNCVLCYDLSTARGVVESLGGVLLYGVIGFVLWWRVRKRAVRD